MQVLPSAVIIVTRTATRYDVLDDVAVAFGAVTNALQSTPGLRGQVTDLRQVVGRNDAAFESTVAEHRRRFFDVAPRNAIVVRTAIGRLQVVRHVAEDGSNCEVFTDMDEAIAYAAG